MITATLFSEITSIPGIWVELELNPETGIKEVNGAIYCVNLKGIVFLMTGNHVVDKSEIPGLDLISKSKPGVYEWVLRDNLSHLANLIP